MRASASGCPETSPTSATRSPTRRPCGRGRATSRRRAGYRGSASCGSPSTTVKRPLSTATTNPPTASSWLGPSLLRGRDLPRCGRTRTSSSSQRRCRLVTGSPGPRGGRPRTRDGCHGPRVVRTHDPPGGSAVVAAAGVAVPCPDGAAHPSRRRGDRDLPAGRRRARARRPRRRAGRDRARGDRRGARRSVPGASPRWPAQTTIRAGSPRTSAAGSRFPRSSGWRVPLRGAVARCCAAAVRGRPAVPRPRPGQGGRDDAAHSLAPGPAVLQRRRRRRQCVDPRRRRARGWLPGGGGPDPPRAVADAAHLPRRRGEVVPRGCARRSCRTSRPTATRTRSACSRWRPAMPCSSTSSASTGHPGSRSPVAAGCCRCATSPRTPATSRGAGAPRRRSRD